MTQTETRLGQLITTGLAGTAVDVIRFARRRKPASMTRHGLSGFLPAQAQLLGIGPIAWPTASNVTFLCPWASISIAQIGRSLRDRQSEPNDMPQVKENVC
jgi:hypothetical protein